MQFSMRVNKFFYRVSVLVFLVFLAACQMVEPGGILTKPEAPKSKEKSGYEVVSPLETYRPSVDQDHYEILAVSGGGHRAAHYAVGTLLALDEIMVKAADAGEQKKSFLDEIDFISSVSGGSYGVAVYIASYLEAMCRNEPVSSASDLLKRNRFRLEKMASAWFLNIAGRFGGLPVISDKVTNLDYLEQNFHSELTRVSMCKDGSVLENPNYLTVKDITRKRDAVPPVHVVNATNSHTGQVFPFYNLKIDREQTDRLQQNDFNAIGCYRWRGKWRGLHDAGDLPYSLALASSSAFPPLVSDGVFQLRQTDSAQSAFACGEGGNFLRLTDGGQADDNGVDTALIVTSNLLRSTMSAASDKKALLISMDALVEPAESTVKSLDGDGLFELIEVAILRNADLPRYSKKRELKRALRNTTQKKVHAWEQPDENNALFGVSIGFSRSVADFDCLAFGGKDANGCQDSSEISEDGSDVSTFKNSYGLSLEQRISTIAEGYYQTLRRLFIHDAGDKVSDRGDVDWDLRNEAHNAAFDLLCTQVDREKPSKECTSYLQSQVELSDCFQLHQKPLAIVSSGTCDASFAKQEQSRNLIRFNSAQETTYRLKVKELQRASVSNFIDAYSNQLSSALYKYNKELEARFGDATVARLELFTEVEATRQSVLDVLLNMNSLNNEVLNSYEELKKNIRNDLKIQKAKFDRLVRLRDWIKQYHAKAKSEDGAQVDISGKCYLKVNSQKLVLGDKTLEDEDACRELSDEFSDRAQTFLSRLVDVQDADEGGSWEKFVSRTEDSFSGHYQGAITSLENAYTNIKSLFDQKGESGKKVPLDNEKLKKYRGAMENVIVSLDRFCKKNKLALKVTNEDLRTLFNTDSFRNWWSFNQMIDDLAEDAKQNCTGQEYYRNISNLGRRKVEDQELVRVFNDLSGFQKSARQLVYSYNDESKLLDDVERSFVINRYNGAGAEVLFKARMLQNKLDNTDMPRRLTISNRLNGLLDEIDDPKASSEPEQLLELFYLPSVQRLNKSFRGDALARICNAATGNENCDIVKGLQIGELLQQGGGHLFATNLKSSIERYLDALTALENDVVTLPPRVLVTQQDGIDLYWFKINLIPVMLCLNDLNQKLKGFNPDVREWASLNGYFKYALPKVEVCQTDGI